LLGSEKVVRVKGMAPAGTTILIVDDDRPLRERLARAFEDRGFVTLWPGMSRARSSRPRPGSPSWPWWI
jgi:ActR/RegA family two-component response regulator